MIGIIEARYVSAHVLWLRFNDGLEGDVDLASDLTAKYLSHSKTRQCFVPSRSSLSYTL